MSSPATFGLRVRVERERLGWTMRELSRKSGIDISTVWRVENGREVWLSRAVKLADTLGVAMDSMLREPDCARCCDNPPAGFVCALCSREGIALA